MQSRSFDEGSTGSRSDCDDGTAGATAVMATAQSLGTDLKMALALELRQQHHRVPMMVPTQKLGVMVASHMSCGGSCVEAVWWPAGL